MNNKNIWIAVVIIVILIVGYLVWAGMGTSMMPADTASSTTTGVPAGNNNAGTGASAGTNTGVGTGAVGTTGQPPRAPTYTDTITIKGFTAVTANDFPLVNYTAASQASGTGFFSLVGQNTNEVVWGNNQNLSGNYTLDANKITVQENSPSHKLASGEYFIRVQDSTGTIVGESKPFRLSPGQVTGN